MKFSSSNSLASWVTVVIASSCHLPASTRCLKVVDGSARARPAMLTKRWVIPRPGFVFIPLIGPLSFNTMFDWGCPIDWRDYSPLGSDYEARVKLVATQAISETVEAYVEAHPETAKRMSLDLREIWLEQHGQLPKQDRARALKARKDLQTLFAEHPELQLKAEERFQEKVDLLFLRLSSSDPPTQTADHQRPVPKDWAHVSPQND